MGLSASQARLLSLTARQSNLEYEGQQINQQRTSLSNESSNYYNSLLEMTVPVPPSVNDYTKIVYTFIIGGNEATVIDALPRQDFDHDGNATYLVTFTTEHTAIGVQENYSYRTNAQANRWRVDASGLQDPYTGDYEEGQTYYLAAMNSISTPEERAAIIEEYEGLNAQPPVFYVRAAGPGDASNPNKIIGPTGYEISFETYDNLTSAEKAQCKFFQPEPGNDNPSETRYMFSYVAVTGEENFEQYQADNVNMYRLESDTTPNDGDTFVYTYQSSGGQVFSAVDHKYADSFVNAGLNMNDYYQYTVFDNGQETVRFVKRADVEGNLNPDVAINGGVNITTSAVTSIKRKVENKFENAHIEFDARGRISVIYDDNGIPYTMTATTETDNDAYEDAYNQYEYNQYLYDQKQNEINANIKILQAQDKSLELRLSSLDTQHSAIQTEMEAVKKVMSKNIDNSFKTFNA